jgi:hypothetical protein
MQDPRHDQPLVSRTGAGRQESIFSFQSREKNVLDFSSYRSGVYRTLRFLFAKDRSMSVIEIFRQLLASPLRVFSKLSNCEQT